MKDRSGYIYEYKGKWVARITVQDNEGKRRNIKRTAKTKSEAKGFLKTLLQQLDTEGIKGIDSAKLTFNDLAKYYIENYVVEPEYYNDRKLSGLRDWKRRKNMVKMFCSYFGNRKVREITYGDLLTFRTSRLKAQKKNKTQRTITTVNRELACLRRIFNIALRQDWIIKNPFNRGESLIEVSAERQRERILTLDEERRLLEVCSGKREIRYTRKEKEITAKIDSGREHLKSLIIALLDTGARKGEMLKLTWRFVDFKNRVITFQALNTKTLRKRKAAITQRLFDELQMLWEKSDKQLDSLVFGIIDNVSKSFYSACNDARIQHGGIDGITLHSLRHTAATRLVKGQMPIQMVGRILGHTQPQTTYRYLTANDETLFQAASIFESIQR